MTISPEQYGQRLAQLLEQKDVIKLYKVLLAIKENIEIAYTSEYRSLLMHVHDKLLLTLRVIEPEVSFVETADEQQRLHIPEAQRVRNTVLEILLRLPCNEHIRDYALSTVIAMIQVLINDNEDNAVLAMKIMIDLHKASSVDRSQFAQHMQPFFDFAIQVYGDAPRVLAKYFKLSTTTTITTTTSATATTTANPPPTSSSLLLLDDTLLNSQTMSGSTAVDEFGAAESLADDTEMESTTSSSSTTNQKSSAASSSSQLQQQQQQGNKRKRLVSSSRESCKLLVEIPLLLLLLLSSEPAKKNMNSLVTKIVESYSVHVQPPSSPSHPFRQQYLDFIHARLKTLSFLVYAYRTNQACFADKEVLVKIGIDLLMQFPNELTSLRKDLLFLMKHMIDSKHLELQKFFTPYIEQLLNERVLLGLNRSSFETLRPLAYNMVADLIHQVKMELTPAQITKSVIFFTRVIYDPTLSLNHIQIMSAKLLVHLIESIYSTHGARRNSSDYSSDSARDIVIHLLSSFVTKLKTLSITINQLKETDNEQSSTNTREGSTTMSNELQQTQQPQTPSISDSASSSDEPMNAGEGVSHGDKDSTDDASSSSPTNQAADDAKHDGSLECVVYSTYKHNTPLTDDVNHCRTMFRTLLVGLKNVIYVMKTGLSSPGLDAKTNPFTGELKLFMTLFKHGLDCFPVYTIGAPSKQSRNDEKQGLDIFSSLFTILPVHTFVEIFKEQLPYLYERSIDNPIYLDIPSHFLSNQTIAGQFNGLVLDFLLGRMDRMAGSSPEATTMLKLFKIVIGSVVSFQDEELCLMFRPYLSPIVKKCLTCASQSKESVNYFLTLRALFRSIVSGKFDTLIKEFAILVPDILDKLTEFLRGSYKPNVRELFIELCVTIPAKSHTLGPHLPILARPVLLALQSEKDDLVVYALKNLDIWVNSMRIESLEPILKPIMPDLLYSLFSHLKPAPYAYGNLAMRILAKLGGFNRKYLMQPSLMKINEYGEDALKIKVEFRKAQEDVMHIDVPQYLMPEPEDLFLSLDSMIELARTTIISSSSIDSRLEAFNFLNGCLFCFLDFSGDVSSEFNPRIVVPMAKRTQGKTINLYSCNNYFDPYSIDSKSDTRQTQGKKTAECELLKSILVTIISLCHDEQLKDRVRESMLALSRHFALLSMTLSSQTQNSSHNLNPELFLDAIVEVFCAERLDDCPESSAELVLEEFITTIDVMCNYNDELVSRFDVWRKLVARFLHCCSQKEWYKKCAGCTGIMNLCQNLPLCVLRDHDLDFVKKLIFIIKDSPSQIEMFTVDEANKALEMVIRVCFSGTLAPSTTALSSVDQKRIHDLTLVLVSELSSAHAAVRATVQSLIKLVSELSHKSITVLLDPFRGSLNSSIRDDRLSQLSIHLQTGFCEAVTFFLSLDPPLLHLTPPIRKIVDKALAIVSGKKDEQGKEAERRMACLRLMKEALNFPDLKASEHQQLRNKIIEVFFGCLDSPNKEVVDIAKSGLAAFILQQRLPKELLQSSLRPILSNLNNVQKLTLDVLRTLSHLLELCTSYFSVKLGEQLEGHLRKWEEPSKVTHIADKFESLQVAAQILSLFSLLPPDAKKYLKDLVQLTLQLENIWHEYCTEYSSPFRKPLAKFLNQYPEETLNYFFQPVTEKDSTAEFSSNQVVLDSDESFKLFIFVLLLKSSGRLRSATQNAGELLISALNRNLEDEQAQRHSSFKVLYIIKVLSKLNPEWLAKPQNKHIFDQMVTVWKSTFDNSKARNIAVFDQIETKRVKYMLQCFINYALHVPSDVEIPYLMLNAFSDHVMIDCTFVSSFFAKELPKYSVSNKKLLFKKFIEVFNNKSVSLKIKILGLQHIIIPTLAATFDRKEGDDAIDDEILDAIIKDMLGMENVTDHLGESLRVELLQLTTLLVQYYLPKKMVHYRKHIMRFTLEHIHSSKQTEENTATRQCGYLLAAYFIKAFETPEKIVTSVYVNLLKAHQVDGKATVKQALDILVEVLPTRLSNQKNPPWISWTKKILTDEVHTQAQIIHIWQLFVRHPNVFYPFRENFISRMVNSLNRIGATSSPMEYKKLSIDLAELILQWEEKLIDSGLSTSPYENITTEPDTQKRAIQELGKDTSCLEPTEEPASKKSKSEDGEAKTTQESPNVVIEYRTPMEEVDLLINFLSKISYCVFANSKNEDRRKQRELSARSVELIKRASKIWPAAKIHYANIEKFIPRVLESAKQQARAEVAALTNTLVLMNLAVDHSILDLSSFAKFAPCLPRYMHLSNEEVLDALANLFNKLLTVYPYNSNSQMDVFYHMTWTILKESINAPLNNMNMPTDGISGVLVVLQIMCQHASDKEKQEFSEPVHRLFGKLLFSEHIHTTASQFKVAHQQQAQSGSNTAQSSSRQLLYTVTKENTTHVRAILMCLDFLSDGVHEQVIRKPFLTSMSNIISKSNQINSEIVTHAMKKLKNWLLFSNPTPEVKRYELSPPQKKHFLDAMVSSVQTTASPEFTEEYYSLLLSLYQDQDLLNSDTSIAQKIESTFMSGLKYDSANTKKLKFINVLNQRLGKTVFERLSFIMQSHRWESLNDTFWIKYALDILLDSVNENCVLSLEDSLKMMPLQSEDSEDAKMDDGESGTTLKFSEPAQVILREHARFILAHKDQKLGSVVAPIRDLASREGVKLSYDMWVSLFPHAWRSLTPVESQSLQQPLLTLLARDYHSKQYVKYPNVIQALLEGISKCEPKITISPEMLKFLGKSFNAWNIAIPMLESELQTMITNGYFDERTERFCNALAELYRVLSEEDMLCGVWSNFDVSEHTKYLFSLEQFGLWAEAQDALKNALFSLQKGTIINRRMTNSELGVWEEHWLACAKKLQQWDELTKFAKNSNSNSTSLMLECYWKNGNWKQIKDVFAKYPTAENQMMKIYNISVAIMDDKDKDIDYFQSSAQIALQRWCALPQFLCSTHIAMLHNFQQLFELQESHQLQTDSMNSFGPNELKSFLSTWRDRIPNKWDDITMWSDILTWRCHFLKYMSKKLESNKTDQKGDKNEQNRVLCLNEAIWTQNKLAKICRKQDLIEPALKLLGESQKLLNTLKIDSNESFVRIYELLKCYMKDGRFSDALDLIDSDSSSKFKTNQKMDILRLRGECLMRLGRRDESYQTFSQSISYFPQDPRYLSLPSTTLSLGKVFFSWAKMLDDVFIQNLNAQASGKPPVTVNGMQGIDIAEQAVVSYMQALRYSGGATNHQQHQIVGWNCRQHISRILWLLSYDEDHRLGRVMEKSNNDIPAWMWIPYTQNLFSLLLRSETEAKIGKLILLCISKKYPQAIYYNLRSVYFELREIVKQSSSQDKTKQPEAEVTAIASALDPKIRKHHEDLMGLVLRIHQSMVHEVEAILKELCNKLKPEFEEEVQRALEILLAECYKHNIYADDSFKLDDEGDFNMSNSSSIPEYIADMCRNFYRLCFENADQPNVKMSQLLKDSQEEIRRGIVPSIDGPQNLVQLTDGIKHWLRVLQKRVNLLPIKIPMSTLSPFLSDTNVTEIEIPGQYVEFDKEPYTEQHEKIMYFLTDVDVVRRNKVSCRSVSMRSQSGKVFKYLVQSIGPTENPGYGRSEERMWALVRHFNKLLEKDKSTHKKHLQIYAPTIIPLSQRIRLVHEKPMYSSLEDVYINFCVKEGINVDKPILDYWSQVNQVCMNHQKHIVPRMDAFNQVVKNIPDDILSKFLQKTCLGWNEFYQLRKNLSTQVGLYNVLEYLFNIQDRSLHKVMIGRNSGEMFQFDFRPTFDKDTGRLARQQLPFQFSRNMVNFISPFGMQGFLLNSMSVACHGLSTNSDHLASLLRLYIRDELVSWQSISGGIMDSKFSQNESLLRATVQSNVDDLMSKIREMNPQPATRAPSASETSAEYAPPTDPVVPLNEKIMELIQTATSTDQLCLVSPPLHPWF